MKIKGIGVNSHGGFIDGNLEAFEKDMAFSQECGVDYVELSTHALDFILRGQFIPKRMNQALDIIRKFDMKYTIHSPNDLNLCDLRRLEIQREVFKRNLEFASMVKAEVLVYHSGVRMPWNEDQSLAALMAVEREELSKMADLAAELGVAISVENANPTFRDMREKRVNSYGVYLDQLAEQVEKINHPNVGVCLDYGHAYLAANYHGYDYLQAVDRVMKLVNHIHIHDNLGIVMSSERPYMYHYTFGEDDLHLPMAWGEVPFEKVFQMESSQPLIFLIELKPRFMVDLPECIDYIQRMAVERTTTK